MMTASAISLHRERIKQLALFLAVPVLLGFVMGWNGGRGVVAELPKSVALVYWISFFVWLWVLMAIGTRFARMLLAPWEPRVEIVTFVGGMIGGLVARPIYSLHQRLFFDNFLPAGATYRIWSPFPRDFEDLRFILTQALFAAMLWFIATMLLRAIAARPIEGLGLRAPAEAPASPPELVAPLSVLPRVARVALIRDAEDILLIRAHDHYLHIDTRQGERTALYRFRDAVEDLVSQPGVQIHRSYWIRLDAVGEFDPANERVRGRFAGGAWIPVQKKYLPVLKVALRSLT